MQLFMRKTIANKHHADENPKSGTLFRDISTYILNQTSQSSTEPASKKRKLEDSNGAQNGSAGGDLFSAEAKAWRSYPGVSFSLPQRKKFTLELVLNKKEGGIRGVGADGKVEFGIAWKDVGEPSHAACGCQVRRHMLTSGRPGLLHSRP
jgi:hypothetical protein